MSIHEADDIDPAIAEQFWENVVAYEKAPFITHLAKLERTGKERFTVLKAPEAYAELTGAKLKAGSIPRL